jgi:hypothetical protein
VDVSLDHRGVHPEFPPAGYLQRAGQLDGLIIQGRHRLGTDRVRPTDEGGVVRDGLQVEPTELPQDDRIGDEVLSLFVAEVVEPFDHQHPQDHLDRRGVAPEPSRVGIPAAEIRFDPLEEDIVVQQPIQLSQLWFEPQLELGDQLLEEVLRIVAIDYHGGQASGRVRMFEQTNPNSGGSFRTAN